MIRYTRIALVVAFATLLGTLGSTYFVAGWLAAPTQTTVGDPPAELRAETVSIPVGDGSPISGWLVEGSPAHGGVLLLHSYRSDRRSMVPRIRFLKQAGYTTLLVDLRSHGETTGDGITFGVREAEDVTAALAYLKDRVQGRPTGVIGFSLGGAATLMADRPLQSQAVVLEAVYPRIQDAINHRLELRLGPLGQWLTPLFLWQLKPRLGIELDELAPISRIGDLGLPVMVVGGSEDRRTPERETRLLYERASDPKSLWIVPGARHEDLYLFDSAAYEARILEFLGEHLAR